MTVSRGEVVGLLGPNGAGKTTAFSILAGTLAADRGRIALDGRDVTHLTLSDRATLGVAFLPQESYLVKRMSVEKNLLLSLESRYSNERLLQYGLDELLARFCLDDVRKRRAGDLSGGERRRCEIAALAGCGANYMLLDEPFSGLDPIIVNDLSATLRLLASQGASIIITDHNVRETLSTVDRSYIIDGGRIVAEGSATDIVQNPLVRRIYLGEHFRL
jgi:lipopolysaccharide export system ATP-binding protein